MGKHRSRDGCLTCRTRRVKCDETHPVCKACSKKNRPCRWEAPHTRFKDYQPEASSSKSPAGDDDEDDDDNDGYKTNCGITGEEEVEKSGEDYSGSNSPKWKSYPTEAGSVATVSSLSTKPSPKSPFFSSPSTSATVSPSIGGYISLNLYNVIRAPLTKSTPLTRHEAGLVHHYTECLGRWLDCTDATRQFTLGIPEKLNLCPVLRNAVLSFAARHRRDVTVGEEAYQRCIALLIERLDEQNAGHDDKLLCAIVILRFYEQLNVPSSTGSDDGQHLAGCAAIIRTSQGHQFVDPSAPTLREAAFWVYVRQCLYNATIHQQCPDIDFSLELHPLPSSMEDAHPLKRLRVETAWANQMTWYTARVVNYCFESTGLQTEGAHKLQRWQELWELVQTWNKDRPQGFDPIFEEQFGITGVFPAILFTADWHVVSFVFYHFACILLLNFKPGLKFRIHNADVSSAVNREVLLHARAICGATKSAPETVPLSITVCHTIFIWGPLVSDTNERNELIQLLTGFEEVHLWPTTWITNTLKKEWGLEASL